MKIPTFFVVGAPKCGTTALYSYLAAHPTPGYVQLTRFSWKDLLPENAPVIQTLVKGVTRGEPFLNPMVE